MAANNNPVVVSVIMGKQVAFPAATSTTLADIFIGDTTESTRIDTLVLTTDETAVSNIALYSNDGTNDYLMATIPTTIGAGGVGVAPVNLLTATNMAPHIQYDGAGNPFMNLAPGWKIRAKFPTTLTTAKTAWVKTMGGKY